MAHSDQLTVFYDGACPLCAREIGFYKEREGADSISWIDVSQTSEREVVPGLTKESALARFHVMQSGGALVSGGRAFAELWAALPGFRLAGKIARTAPLAWLLEQSYRIFLSLRPRLQAMASRSSASRPDALPAWLLGDLRSDHAGEVGAIAIYQGILAVTRDPELRRFAEAHRRSERQHLALIETLLPRSSRSIFVPLWRVAGFLTGAVPALFGRRNVFATIAAVETFVDRHYAEQVERLSQESKFTELRALLESCRLDEVRHRDEAREALAGPPGAVCRLWCRMVGAGSAGAVAVARRL